jgi:hypothetical protein
LLERPEFRAAADKDRYPLFEDVGNVGENAEEFNAIEELLQSRGAVAEDSFAENAENSEALAEVNDNELSGPLADFLLEIGFDRQLVIAVSESHEGAAEWMAVDCAADFHEAARAEERGGIGPHHVGPAALRGRFLQLCFELFVQRPGLFCHFNPPSCS